MTNIHQHWNCIFFHIITFYSLFVNICIWIVFSSIQLPFIFRIFVLYRSKYSSTLKLCIFFHTITLFEYSSTLESRIFFHLLFILPFVLYPNDEYSSTLELYLFLYSYNYFLFFYSNIRQHWNYVSFSIQLPFIFRTFVLYRSKWRIFINIGIAYLFPHNYFLFFIRIFINIGIAYLFPYNYLLFFILSYFIDPNIRQH